MVAVIIRYGWFCNEEEKNILHHYINISGTEYKYGPESDLHLKAQNDLLALIIDSLAKLKENPPVSTLDFDVSRVRWVVEKPNQQENEVAMKKDEGRGILDF